VYRAQGTVHFLAQRAVELDYQHVLSRHQPIDKKPVSKGKIVQEKGYGDDCSVLPFDQAIINPRQKYDELAYLKTTGLNGCES
jgi:hypothetical protein